MASVYSCGRFSLRLGGAFNVDAVLVGAGGEDGVESLHVFQRADGIGGDGGVGVADVRSGVGVVDRGGQVVFVHQTYFYLGRAAAPPHNCA